MIKLFFILIFLLTGPYSLKAAEILGGDQDFIKELNSIKNPFEDGLPIPAPVKKKSIPHPHIKPRLHIKLKPKRKKPQPPVVLPALKLEGVIVGEDVNEAIINDQVVTLLGSIKGARVVSMSKEGVEVLFKGKKFFLKID